ncbi:MAG: ferritin-like domain-containing protein [Bradymonadaceae bacterium]
MAHTYRKELLIDWLRDAYAIEKALTQVLDNQAKRAEIFPHVSSRLQGHLEVTRRHADMVKSCIERNGANISRLKSGVASVFGELQSQSLTSSPANVVRDAIMGAAAEQMEISTYLAIITLAQDIGDDETVRICKEILTEEEEMHAWLEGELPTLVREAVQKGELK